MKAREIHSEELELLMDILPEILSYDPDTGIFHWRNGNGRNVNPGDIAGWLNSCDYRCITIGYKQYLAHRLAWFWCYGEFPAKGLDVDHINQVKDDNRFCNLRLATRTQNKQNGHIYSNNTTGFKGVSYDHRRMRFTSNIRVNKKLLWLGYFHTAEEASASYQKAADKHFGEFSNY